MKYFSLLGLPVICSIGFAGTMGDTCKSSNITTPCEKNQWHLEGHALYIQPNAPIYTQ